MEDFCQNPLKALNQFVNNLGLQSDDIEKSAHKDPQRFSLLTGKERNLRKKKRKQAKFARKRNRKG